jgi:hypothetical protein
VNAARIELLGSRFDRIDMQSTIEQCMAWCQGPRVAHTVITLNAALLCSRWLRPRALRAYLCPNAWPVSTSPRDCSPKGRRGA